MIKDKNNMSYKDFLMLQETERSRIADIDYDDVKSLRLEARLKLKQFQPVSVGQASRISGVSPADISVLLVYLEHFHAANAAHNE